MSRGGRAVLGMRGVWRSFASPGGDVEVLRGVDLALESGAFVALTGPSGVGKTTLLHLAGLLDRPSAGEVSFEGRAVASMSDREADAARAERIGFVFQRYHLLPSRTVIENVRFRFRYGRLPAAEARRLADRAVEALGLRAVRDRPARLLSGGEMQRTAIARAIALPPRLLLADEPTGNVDPDTAALIVEVLQRLKAGGTAILMATHNPSVRGGADRVLACAGGVLDPVEASSCAG